MPLGQVARKYGLRHNHLYSYRRTIPILVQGWGDVYPSVLRQLFKTCAFVKFSACTLEKLLLKIACNFLIAIGYTKQFSLCGTVLDLWKVENLLVTICGSPQLKIWTAWVKKPLSHCRFLKTFQPCFSSVLLPQNIVDICLPKQWCFLYVLNIENCVCM